MSATKNQRSMWKGGKEPDAVDIKAVINSFWEEFEAAPDVHIYPDLTGEIIVEVACEWYPPEGQKVLLIEWQRLAVGGKSLDVLIFQGLHRVWHRVDAIYMKWLQKQGAL